MNEDPALFTQVADTRKGHLGERQAGTPVTPYNGSSGWSGSDTSRERAERDDSNGTTSARQSYALLALDKAGRDGLTWAELAKPISWHHGSASGALSVLHKQGLVARLKERRMGCKVYVLPEHVAGRDTEAHGRKPRVCPNCGYEGVTQ